MAGNPCVLSFAVGVPEKRARFYGMIAVIDENVGKLRRTLDDLDLADDTILFFMGDNGTRGGVHLDFDGFPIDGYNAGMRGRKCWAFEGGHRNSCLIHWPAGGPAGGPNVDALCAHMDLFPKLVHLCGLSQPAVDFDGRDIAALLRGEQLDHEAAAILMGGLVLCWGPAAAQTGGSYDLAWFTVDSGGTTSGGSYSIDGSVGQFDATGALSGGQFELAGGFWYRGMASGATAVELHRLAGASGPPMSVLTQPGLITMLVIPSSATARLRFLLCMLSAALLAQ